MRVLVRKYIRQEQEEELNEFVLPATGYSNVDMNVRTGKERKQRGMEGEQDKEGLFRIVYGRKGGWHRVLGGGKDAGSSTSNLGAGADEVGAAEEQGGSKTFRSKSGGRRRCGTHGRDKQGT